MTTKYRNLLLKNLSLSDLALVEPNLKRIDFSLYEVFEKRHAPIESIYFIESGIASVVAETASGRKIEVGLFGRDGMTGSSLFAHDHQSPFECFAQVEGQAFRIPSASLIHYCNKSQSLRLAFSEFARAFSLQTAFTAVTTGHARVEQRLARWLVMVHDRVDGDTFSITHGLLAIMLGVRRSSVTVALQNLEGYGLIRSTRSLVEIRDRDGLIAATGESYGPAEAEYLRLTGADVAKSDRGFITAA